MLYRNLKFPKPAKKRPYFYTNFVQTVDGKTAVAEEGYWPIGSKQDYEVLTELRTYADCLIHGGNLARQFGEQTIKSISKRLFQQIRRVMGKSANLPYYVITKHPQSLAHLRGEAKQSPGSHLGGEATVFSGDLLALVEELKEQKYEHVLVEGGPTLLGSFLKEGLIDEIFLTIAPRLFGSKPNSTKTLIEGVLLPPNKIKLKLSSVKKIKDELFLRYKVNY